MFLPAVDECNAIKIDSSHAGGNSCGAIFNITTEQKNDSGLGKHSSMKIH